MKKIILLTTAFFSLSLSSTEPDVQSWMKIYSVKKQTPKSIVTIASCLYYLIQHGSHDTLSVKQALDEFYQASKLEHSHCKNALLKAYERSYLAHYPIKEKQKKQKNHAWRSSLFEYYQNLLEQLAKKDQTICYGPDKGKPLPQGFLFKEMPTKTWASSSFATKVHLKRTLPRNSSISIHLKSFSV